MNGLTQTTCLGPFACFEGIVESVRLRISCILGRGTDGHCIVGLFRGKGCVKGIRNVRSVTAHGWTSGCHLMRYFSQSIPSQLYCILVEEVGYNICIRCRV